jgi:AcrR family transcriptional regulator
MNHDMNTGSSDGRTLRDRQADATRRAIVDAFLDLAHAENVVSVSMPAVAAEAGVSVRTVYRYFPSKDALQDAAAQKFAEEAMTASGTTTVDTGNARHYLTELWTGFARQVPAVLAEHCTPVGRELRASRLPGARNIIRAALPAVADDPETVDLLVAVMSSSMFIELVVRMGHTPERAVAMVTDLADLIVDTAETVTAPTDTGHTTAQPLGTDASATEKETP